MKTKNHRNDEPLILPSDCTAIVFRPDGIEMHIPPTNTKGPVGTVGLNIMRAAILFGTGKNCDKAREFVDELIAEQRGNVVGPD